MLNKTTFTEFESLAKQSTTIGIYQEIAGDNLTPIGVFLALGKLTQNATLLESTPATGKQARYSYLGLEPLALLTLKNKPNALSQLRKFYQQHRCAIQHPQSGFLGGIVGFIAYDAVRQFENIPNRHQDLEALPDFAFTSYRTNITFDHVTNKIVISRKVVVEKDLTHTFTKAMAKLQQLIELFYQAPTQPLAALQPKFPLSTEVSTEISDEEYCQLVNQAKEYIKNGDIFQVVLSRKFTKKLTASPFSVYRALRMVSPAPYLFYLDRKDYVITGASPEKLISVTKQEVSSFPIAGTRPRSANQEINEQLAIELLQDEKELAEHVMLVDLARNDLGKTCEPGSVSVKSFKQVQQYSHVMHITSEVIGKLQPHHDALDALAAAFPAGTLSGAPKIRAMEIIDELEQSKRGAYGGVICFIDYQGHLNSCITIRTAVIKEGLATVRTGSGIVFDSIPEQEAQETHHKARSILAAIDLAEGGLS
ncbi:MAG: hypothetical protein A3E87_08525 [Gammaproteobacteria bacterium RIFCSPHIGHO2_12_FULL_35_23]|nr:MAG: hypothetical protein A3E87_08525 [Gammaproteobacteria bacterium RIFCSPHIGHO2_12_FULL_35_23]